MFILKSAFCVLIKSGNYFFNIPNYLTFLLILILWAFHLKLPDFYLHFDQKISARVTQNFPPPFILTAQTITPKWKFSLNNNCKTFVVNAVKFLIIDLWVLSKVPESTKPYHIVIGDLIIKKKDTTNREVAWQLTCWHRAVSWHLTILSNSLRLIIVQY